VANPLPDEPRIGGYFDTGALPQTPPPPATIEPVHSEAPSSRRRLPPELAVDSPQRPRQDEQLETEDREPNPSPDPGANSPGSRRRTPGVKIPRKAHANNGSEPSSDERS